MKIAVVCLLTMLMVQAAYNVGGHTISADTIQSTILGCRMSRPGQVLNFTFNQVPVLNFR